MNRPFATRRRWTIRVTEQNTGTAIDILARETGLSRNKLKDAMNKGAVQLQRGSGQRKHLRRASSRLQSGDQLIFNYDPEVLALLPAPAKRLWQCREYSLWYKPPGLLAQGNEYGDHACLLRQVELADPRRKPVYLVHRLDREASGLMLIAHNRSTAGKLSRLFQSQQVKKEYAVTVLGRPSESQAEIRLPLDGKPAYTEYELLDHDASSNTSHLRVRIMTGRTHQIRRHLNMLGYPVLGDPRYGQGNKNSAGLQLCAVRLAFTCPLTQQLRDFDLQTLSADEHLD